jgi:DNA-binding transcriptional LysR family regulator
LSENNETSRVNSACMARDIHAVFLASRRMPKHVRAFLDFLTQKMRTMVIQKSGTPPIE